MIESALKRREEERNRDGGRWEQILHENANMWNSTKKEKNTERDSDFDKGN